MTVSKKETSVIADICFPDLPHDQTIAALELLAYYHRVDGGAGQKVVKVGIDGNDFIIDVGLGIHCIFLPLDIVKSIIKQSEDSQ